MYSSATATFTGVKFAGNTAAAGNDIYTVYSTSTATVEGCPADYDEVKGDALNTYKEDGQGTITGDLYSFECTPKSPPPSSDGTKFFTLSNDASTDLYVSYTSSSTPASSPLCVIDDTTGPGSTSQQYLNCQHWSFTDANTIDTYDLSADIVHSACVDDDNCVAFSVANEGKGGTIFKTAELRAFHAKLPEGQPTDNAMKTIGGLRGSMD